MKIFKEAIIRANKIQHALDMSKAAAKIATSQPKPTPTESIAEPMVPVETQNIETVASPTEEFQNTKDEIFEKPKRKSKENQNSDEV